MTLITMLPFGLLSAGCGGPPPCSDSGTPPAESQTRACCSRLVVDQQTGLCEPDSRPLCAPAGSAPAASQRGECCSGLESRNGTCQQMMTPPPAAPADLAFTDFLPRVTSRTGTVYICLNRTPDGTPVNNGDIVRVRNIGSGDASPFSLAIGILKENNTDVLRSCTGSLVDKDGLKAGQSSNWDSSWCCALSTVGLPSGSYRAFGIIDPDQRTTDTNLKNNVALSPSFSVF